MTVTGNTAEAEAGAGLQGCVGRVEDLHLERAALSSRERCRVQRDGDGLRADIAVRPDEIALRGGRAGVGPACDRSVARASFAARGAASRERDVSLRTRYRLREAPHRAAAVARPCRCRRSSLARYRDRRCPRRRADRRAEPSAARGLRPARPTRGSASHSSASASPSAQLSVVEASVASAALAFAYKHVEPH